MNLRGLRKKIDSLDKDIVRLLNRRAQISKEINLQKARAGSGVYSPDRERAVYERLSRLNRGPLANEALRAVYREIMSASLSLRGTVRVAYLGPEWTFTHQAALSKFGTQIEYVGARNIGDVFREVESGRAHYGVVPIENSIEGAVTHTLDMFVDSSLKICSEISLEVSHNLLANCPLEKIRRIYSNPQVFGQCRVYLETNLPHVELVEVSSTARAALRAKDERNSACIASEFAAAKYGLKVLAKGIEDSRENWTRFLVIGRDIPGPTGRDKTSVVFSVQDRVGALYDMLLPFKRAGINLTKIESRPSKRKAWDYYFFVDLIGHVDSGRVESALSELKKKSKFLKVLGSYPVAAGE